MARKLSQNGYIVGRMANNSKEAERFAQAVAAQVRAELAAQSVTVAAVARATGINRETLDRWVKGERKLTVSTLYRIADAINVLPHIIVERAERRFETEANTGGIVTPGPWQTSVDDIRLAASTDHNHSGAIDGDHIE